MQEKQIQHFHQALHLWYEAHGRKALPWRQTPDPYAIYISEIMLQQTQVKTVLEHYYFPFLAKFPDLQTLAAASRDEVLTAWQGLGYYNRALNLHEAAKRSGGTLPGSVEALMQLPGIGRNTAHAVAAFAYRLPVAVMEANVRRVVSRVFALSEPNEALLWEKAEALLDRYSPFDYNQAMMDIGALVCKKRAPLCEMCPANELCEGKASPESYPAAKKAKTPPVRKKNIVVFRNQKNLFYARPRTTRFLSGLYHFVETDSGTSHITCFGEKYALSNAQCLGRIRQQYSHFTLEAEVYCLDIEAQTDEHWHTYDILRKLPTSMAEQKIIDLFSY